MAIDNIKRDWQAHCVTESGRHVVWRDLRHRQAKWRFDFLRSAMRWQGEPLKACGYSRAD